MIRNILAIVDNAGAATPFVRQIVALGEARQAYVDIAALTPSPYLAEALLPVGAMYVPEETLTRDDKAKVEAVEALVRGSVASISVFGLHDDVAWLAGDMGRNRQVADLVLVGAPEEWESPWLRRRVLETLILGSGTPIVILPQGVGLAPVRSAVLGWKPSPEANRALHDLVTLAEPGAAVEIVAVGQDPRSDAGDEVCRHLVRHGLTPRLHRVPAEGMSEAEVLHGFGLRLKTDLLVVGGFGQSRVREIFFGGVTRALIRETQVPVMFSH